ncbi:hypothetical protein StoSoilB20_06080 [Arthrobacter sp. StoSoilB20]|nr:hypothetical protein StoSoilB20_06080 [Arthrobacter sp. StoSoilB20]
MAPNIFPMTTPAGAKSSPSPSKAATAAADDSCFSIGRIMHHAAGLRRDRGSGSGSCKELAPPSETPDTFPGNTPRRI